MNGAKASIKTAITLAGFGYEYNSAWWSRQVRRQDPLGEWSREHRAIFIHVPKTAGMSIYGSFGIDRPATGRHVPLSGFKAFDKDFCDRAFKFTIVRNPWDRLVSAFHYLKHVPIGCDDKAWGTRHLSSYDSFQDFVAALENPVFRAFLMTWRHFMPQWYFICDRSGRPGADLIVRFEDLERGTRFVAEHLGLPFAPARQNASPRRDYKDYYSDRGRQLVGRMYRRDCAIFHYTF
jgi:hypothetical protein